MNILAIWLDTGVIGAAVNTGFWWWGRQGKLGPPSRAFMEKIEREMEEISGSIWMVPVFTAIGGFLVPPLPLAAAIRFWWLAHRQRICTASSNKWSFEQAMRHKANLTELGGIPADQMTVKACVAGDHYHLFVPREYHAAAMRVRAMSVKEATADD